MRKARGSGSQRAQVGNRRAFEQVFEFQNCERKKEERERRERKEKEMKKRGDISMSRNCFEMNYLKFRPLTSVSNAALAVSGP